MDAQELRNLQKAYMEVVMNELDEGYKNLPKSKMSKKMVSKVFSSIRGGGKDATKKLTQAKKCTML